MSRRRAPGARLCPTLTRMPARPRSAPLMLGAVALALVLVVLALVAILSRSTGHGSPSSRAASSGSETGFDGAALPANTIAPDFTLTDQSGHAVSLSDYRGRVVVLTFLYSTCDATCIVIAQQIRGALDELSDEHARPPAVLIVSADPAADTRASVARFLSQVSLTGRVQYLTGPLSHLRAIWHAYHVKPASSGRAAFDDYASVLLVDGEGHERVLFESEELTPESLAHDIRMLQSG
jgi:protein SCO1